MARLQIRLNVGPGATLGALSSVVEDLSVLQDLGLRVDTIAAGRDAEATIERWWREQPSQIYERSLRLDERESGAMRRLLDQRRRDDEIIERLADVPPELWFEEWYRIQRRYLGKVSPRRLLPPPVFWSSLAESRLQEVAPELFAQLVADEASQRLPSVPTVERLVYENPVELVLIGVASVLTGAGFKFGTFTEFAKLIRDWSADKQERQAKAREASAAADQAEARVQREIAEAERTEAETREIHARASRAELEAEIMRRYALRGNRVDDLVEAGLAPRELQAIARLSEGTVDVEMEESGP